MRSRSSAALVAAISCWAILGSTAVHAVEPKSVTLTIPQTRSAARAALAQGDDALAIRLAEGLLQADPKDAQAYYIIAHAYRRLGDPTLGRKAAGYAFRYSKHERDRYTTAQLAARMAVQEKRYTLAQYWLRRSFDYVPDERLRKQAVADFKRLRAENPWMVQLSFSIDPSTNVNSGAGDPWNEIDGSDLPAGLLSPSSLALSGAVVNSKINAAYRLNRTKTTETHLTFRAFTRQAILSKEAKELLASTPPPPPPLPAPPVPDNSDFSSYFAEIGLMHSFRLGTASGDGKGNGYGQLGVTYGQSHYGGQLYYQTYKGTFKRVFTLSGGRSLGFGLSLEHRDYRGSAESDSGVVQLFHSSTLGNGAKLSLGVNLARTKAPATAPNLRNDYAGGYVAFEPARKLGPARVSMIAGASVAQYDDYRVGFFPVPGGRQDKTVQGIVSLHFEDYDFAGFSPTLTLRGRKTQSNVGRFDTEEVTLSIGIKSNF